MFTELILKMRTGEKQFYYKEGEFFVDSNIYIKYLCSIAHSQKLLTFIECRKYVTGTSVLLSALMGGLVTIQSFCFLVTWSNSAPSLVTVITFLSSRVGCQS